MTPRTASEARPPRLLIAGGGVAALEACLCLRARAAAPELAIDLLTPDAVFSYRPLTVAEPFGGAQPWRIALECFAAEQALTLIQDTLAAVDPAEATVVTGAGVRAGYDRLLVAVGADAVDAVPGAVSPRGPAAGGSLRRVLDAAGRRLRARLAFVVRSARSWPVPLYELALLAAAELRARGTGYEVSIVTPEPEPLALLGPRASALVGEILRRRDVAFVGGATATEADGGELCLTDRRVLRAEHVLALPWAGGRAVTGLPRDEAGFVPVDAHGRVRGVAGVLAAGDATGFPLKQAGLAALQADAAAETILAELGFPVEPQPFAPVLDGRLSAGYDPSRLRRDSGHADVGGHALWWHPGRIAGRFLAPILLAHAGIAAAVPGTDAVPVRVDLAEALAAHAAT